jgi:hypothetical protein
VTSQGSAGTRFQRSIQARNVFLAETAAFEMGSLSLEDALQLLVLYAEAEDDKFAKAAVRWLGRLLLERPMPLAVVAHAVELVSQLRGPGGPGGLLARSRRSRRRKCRRQVAITLGGYDPPCVEPPEAGRRYSGAVAGDVLRFW